jgi:gliding-associated putative ABC transporter substrate-binding component GldG
MSKNKKIWWLTLVAGLLIINVIAAFVHQRFDLTEEKRYSLSTPTKNILRNLDSTVTIDVFLTGNELPAVVRKFRNALIDFLNESKEYGKTRLVYNFINPYETVDTAQTSLLDDSLNKGSIKDTQSRRSQTSLLEDSLSANYGLTAVVINAPDQVGDELKIKKLIHGAVLRYGDKAVGVDLLKGARSFGTDPEQLAQLYNDVEASIEYKFGSAIQKLTAAQKPVVAYALGHGEGWGYNVDDAVRTLFNDYSFDTLNLNQVPYIPAHINALIFLKPTSTFNDRDKLKIDQYLMNGGKVFLMMDNMYAEFDSLYKSNGFVAFDRGLNLEDILFTYGVRINQTLLQDMQCDKLPQMSTEGQQQRLVDWPFFPILDGTDHPVSKNLDGIRTLFPTTIDTVLSAGVRKTVLLTSSNNSRLLNAPAKIDFEFLQIAPDQALFRHRQVPVAVLLEGSLRSHYRGRVSKAVTDSLKAYNTPFQQASDKAKLIVVSDGDIAMNQFSPSMGPLPMGMNVFTRYTYANKDFFTNCLEYLVNPSNILQTRSKEYTLRLLDINKVQRQKSTWQFINVALPVLLVILFGIIYQQVRKRKFSSA